MIAVGLVLLVGGVGALVVNAAAWMDASRSERRSRARSSQRRALVLAGTTAVVVGAALTWTALLTGTS